MSDNENFSAARGKQGIRYTADEEHRRTSSSTQNNESTYEPLEDLQIGNGSTLEMDTSRVRFHMSTCTNAEPLTLQSDEDICISKTTTGVNVDSQMTNKFEPPACKPIRNIRIAEDLNTTSDKKSMTYVGISTQEPVVRTSCDNDSSVTKRKADDQGHTPATTKENITDYELPPPSNTLNQVNSHSDMSASAGISSWEPSLEFLDATVSSPVRKSYCSTATELSSWEQNNVEQLDNMDFNHDVSRDDVRSAINKVFTVLVDYMDPIPILYKMNEERIFTRPSTLRDIMEKPTTSEKNRNLLDIIIRRDVPVYLHFKRFLRDTKQEPIFQLLEIAERGGDTREAIDMIKQCATDLNDQDNILLRELAAAITMSDVKKKMSICYVYVYIGKEVCRALLEKQINDLRPSDSLAWTIDAFIEMNIENIKPILTKENTRSLFPTAKPDLWNLSLFCHLLINTTCKISRPLRVCLKWLVEQETEIESYNDQNYERKFEHMKECLMTIADETHDEDLIRKVNEFFEPLKDGVIPNTGCADLSRKIDLLTEEFRHGTKANEQKLQKVIKGNIRMEKKLDEVLEKLGNISQSNDALPKSIPDIPVKILLNEISPETEKVASEKIVKTLNHTEAQYKLSEAIEDLNKKFKENGYSITNNLKVGCVQMYIRCTSALSFFTLLKDYVSGRLDAALEQLEKAARMLDGCERVKLETIIFEDDILNILSSFNVCPIEINSTDVSEVGSDTSEANTAESIDTGGLKEDLMNETTTERQLVPDRWKKGNSISVNDPLKAGRDALSSSTSSSAAIITSRSLTIPVAFVDDNLDISPVSFVSRTIDIKDKDITSSTKKSDSEEFASIPAKRATGGKIDLDQCTNKTFDLLCSMCQKKNKNTEAKQFCCDCQDYYCSSCVRFHDEIPALSNHKIINNAQLKLLSSVYIPSPALPTDDFVDITSSTKKSDSQEFVVPKPLRKHPASLTHARTRKFRLPEVRERIPAKMATRGAIDFDQGTGETFDCLCSFCRGRHRYTEGEHFCVDCSDYYCSSHVKIHDEVPALKYHKILNKTQSMPPTSLHFPAVLTESCRVHDNKPVDMFCRQHNSMECATCMEIYHCDSKEKFYLPEHTMNNPTAANPNKIKKQLDDIDSNVAER